MIERNGIECDDCSQEHLSITCYHNQNYKHCPSWIEVNQMNKYCPCPPEYRKDKPMIDDITKIKVGDKVKIENNPSVPDGEYLVVKPAMFKSSDVTIKDNDGENHPAHDSIVAHYPKEREFPSEPRSIVAIRESHLDVSLKIEVIEKLKRIIANKEANYINSDEDSLDRSELSYCEFTWADTEEGQIYWEGIWNKLKAVKKPKYTEEGMEGNDTYWANIWNRLKNSPSQSEDGETLSTPNKGESSMYIFNFTAIESLNDGSGNITRNVIASTSQSIPSETKEAALFDFTLSLDKTKVVRNPKAMLEIKEQHY